VLQNFSFLSAGRKRSTGQLGEVSELLPADLPAAPGGREDRSRKTAEQQPQGKIARFGFGMRSQPWSLLTGFYHLAIGVTTKRL